MKVRRIIFIGDFEDQSRSLPDRIRRKAEKARRLFIENPFHPSLRLHKLSGRMDGHWSISVDRRYRIIFMPIENGNMLFISIGTHAIYD